MAGPFLHLVQYNVDPQSEEAFNEWYNLHILHVLKVPGYIWARRYVAIQGDAKYLTLYLVDNAAAFQRVLVHDVADRLPALQGDDRAKERIGGFHHLCSNVYEQIWGSNLGKPLLTQDHPLLLVVTDGPKEHEEEWNHWYNHVHIPNNLKDPWRVMAARFRAVERAIPSRYPLGPRYLAIYELAGEGAVAAFHNPEAMSPAVRAEYESPERQKYIAMMRNHTRYFYRPISTHWAF